MTTARSALLASLTTALPAARFRVHQRESMPDIIDKGKLGVVAFTNSVAPGATIKTLTYELELWLVTGKQDPSDVDDDLSAGLDTLLSALLALRSVAFRSAERSVTADQLYHGFKITLNAYAATS